MRSLLPFLAFALLPAPAMATDLFAGVHAHSVNTPFTLETLQIIAPYAFGAAIVGLIETLLTAQLVDAITETRSSGWRESWGQGIANIASAFFGGTGGCAMIGQTVINVKTAGARTRISTFVAGVSVLVLTIVLHDLVAEIPMAALTAVMIMVCVATFDWHSIRPNTLRRMPVGETVVMVLTVVVVVATDNLATGVLVGVVAAALVFARRAAHVVTVDRELVDEHTVRYRVRGALFFASSNDLVTRFSYAQDPEHVIVDLSGAHVFDASTVAALDGVEQRYAQHGSTVRVENLNTGSVAIHGRLSGHLG